MAQVNPTIARNEIARRRCERTEDGGRIAHGASEMRESDDDEFSIECWQGNVFRNKGQPWIPTLVKQTQPRS